AIKYRINHINWAAICRASTSLNLHSTDITTRWNVRILILDSGNVTPSNNGISATRHVFNPANSAKVRRKTSAVPYWANDIAICTHCSITGMNTASGLDPPLNI
ncbi:hypothetical protein, partial [Yersinia enterocolitica]